MGRSFESIRMGIKEVSARWPSGALRRKTRSMVMLAEMMKELAEADNEPARIKLIGISKKGWLFDSQF
jgi:hypothetical protein